MSDPDPLDDLRSATCSHGAPSARNLIVTVFGDTVLPLGADTSLSVRTLTRLLDSFGVNERLVRTSLSRLVTDGLLVVAQHQRRSSYHVAPEALALFRDADARIYRGPSTDWDGSWTIVIVDAAEGSAAERAWLRQELGSAGLGMVAPNVMASPTIDAAAVAAVIARVGTLEKVLVSRSQVVEAPGMLGAEELARRCAPLDEVAERYHGFVERFGRFDAAALDRVDPVEAFKLRTLVIATFRRIVLDDPLLPPQLLPAGWGGAEARATAGRIYAAVADVSDRFVAATTGWRNPTATADRFEPDPADDAAS